MSETEPWWPLTFEENEGVSFLTARVEYRGKELWVDNIGRIGYEYTIVRQPFSYWKTSDISCVDKLELRAKLFALLIPESLPDSAPNESTTP